MTFRSPDVRQTNEYAHYMESIGWLVEAYSNGQAFIRKVPLLGSVIKIQHPTLPIPFNEIDTLAKKHKAMFVKLEPNSYTDDQLEKNLKVNGFKRDSFPLLPSKTLIIDLKFSEEELFKKLEKDTRNSVRRTIKNNLQAKNSVRNPEEVTNKKFVEQWQENAKQKHFSGASNDEIGNLCIEFNKSSNASIIFISDESTNIPLAGSLLLNNPNSQTTHYMHAFSNQLGRERFAPYRLVWESILFAKHMFKAQSFDMEGIFDERYPKSTSRWKGFAHFKKGFGGEEKTYVGSFTKYYNPLIKLLSIFE